MFLLHGFLLEPVLLLLLHHLLPLLVHQFSRSILLCSLVHLLLNSCHVWRDVRLLRHRRLLLLLLLLLLLKELLLLLLHHLLLLVQLLLEGLVLQLRMLLLRMVVSCRLHLLHRRPLLLNLHLDKQLLGARAELFCLLWLSRCPVCHH